MTSKLIQLSTSSSVVQRRPLTNLALDNKIRAMLSQFHSREYHVTLDGMYTYSKRIKLYPKKDLESKLTYPISNSSIMINDQIKIDEFFSMNKQINEHQIYSYQKVTEWLEYLNYETK
ncbi:unnamed protein product [Adineta steineri]|uniref:Uncharacterized protein n=2 Tax=Adineta steineri TaxID=433720 RepID=A0A815MME6_9BILA|nr:unnamed protein product [Adineta steineri]CAF1470868.1 unnamed protein product [Adineta steineri]CAF3987255.1 unnamed protein product [Adineta steineri]